MTGPRLESATWPEVARGARRRLLLPLGATEQHGPHLPLGTDTSIACAVALRVAEQRDDVVVAPALPYGASGEHAGFAGTLSIGQAGVETAIVELVRSAAGFDEVVLVGWHGGNAEPVARALATLRGEGRRVAAWEPPARGQAWDAHAGRVETALMLAIAPQRVGAARPVGATEPLAELMPALRDGGVRSVSANGVLGDARGASASEGAALLEALVADLSAFLDRAAAADVTQDRHLYEA